MSAPAFQFYARDWIISTRGISPEARGIYIDLLCLGWDQDGIPSEPREIAAMVGLSPQRFRRIWAEIECKWPEAEAGRRRNRRQEEQRDELERLRRKRRRAGLASAEARSA